MNFNNFDKTKSTLTYKGIIAQIYHRKFKTGTFEYVVLPDSVRVIAVTNEKKLILLQEKTFSLQEQYFSLPGGMVDAHEDSKKAALRELEEETGYKAGDIKLWFSHNYSQTVMSRKYFYIATDCNDSGQKNQSKNERIQVRKLNLKDFLKYALKEEFKHIELQNRFFKIQMYAREKKKFMKMIGLDSLE